MALGPLLPIIGAGLLIVGALLFWAAIQNWLADLIQRTSKQLGQTTYTAQSALVVLDRVVVSGQRIISATLRADFRSQESETPMIVEEVKSVRREDLPADILAKLEKGEPLQYELSVGSMKVQEKPKDVTYRLVVRRSK